MKLAYGNYGMPRTPYATMLQQVSEIGYDGIEICVAPGYPTAPDQLGSADRRQLQNLLNTHGLEVASFLLAKIPVITAEAAQHQSNLAYLRQICELRQDLNAGVEISSTLGGRTEEWEQLRFTLAERVADWAGVAAEYDAVFAFEAHVGGLVHTPERALWLLEQVDRPNLKLNFDYSHFELAKIPYQEAIAKLIPYATGVHVKDVQGQYPGFRFLLPGEGELDYADYLQHLRSAGYDGFVTVEISGQVFNAPGYDAYAAARFAYAHLAQAFDLAGIARR